MKVLNALGPLCLLQCFYYVQRLLLPRRVHDISINMLRGYLEVHSLQPDWDLKKVTLTNFTQIQFDLLFV